MTELKLKFTKGVVKRAAAIALAVCMGVTLLPADVFAKVTTKTPTEEDGYAPAYAPETIYKMEVGIGDKPLENNSFDIISGGDPVDLDVSFTTFGSVDTDNVKITSQAEKSNLTIEGTTIKADAGLTTDSSEKLTIEAVNVYGPKSSTVSSIEVTANIKAASGGNPTTSKTTIKVTSAKSTIKVGETTKVTATVNPTSVKYSWKSSSDAIAKVSTDGTVTGVSAGKATITATTTDNQSASIEITVEAAAEKEATAIKINESDFTLNKVGATKQLTTTLTPADAKNGTITWDTSNKKVATVDVNGVVKAVGNGSAKITAKMGNLTSNAVTVKVSVKVTKVSLTLNGQSVKGTLNVKVGEKYTFKTTVQPAKGDNKVKWSIDKKGKKLATVSSKGVVKFKKAGTAKITATATNNNKAKATITLKAGKKDIKLKSVKITGNKKKLKAGKTMQLKAAATPATAKNIKYTWKTSNKKYATVSKKGKVKALKAGKGKTVKITVTAKATKGGSKSKSVSIKITK